MTTTLVVRFPWGRYHATPWGRHVNEGQVELPPSPWRLLRALWAVWKTRVPDLDKAVVPDLLARLGEPPTYFVPPYRLSHTRHYYPDARSRTGTPSTDLTLDAFAVLGGTAELGIRWPFDLPAEEDIALRRLSQSLPYLGRADSLCEARIDPDWQPSGHAICAPLDLADAIPNSLDTVSLLAPQLPLDVNALTQRPVDVRAGRLLFPPATRFVAYPRPPEHHLNRAPRPRPAPPITAVRYTITARVLPPQSEAVALTDRLRAASVRKLGDLRAGEPRPSLLAGRDAQGAMLREHRHAHFLALPDDQRRLAELAVWAPGGFDAEEAQALSRVTRLWAPEGMPGPGPLEIRLAAYGDASPVMDDLVGPAALWRSVTPFVPPRHPKRHRTSFITQEVARELRSRGLPEPADVHLVDDADWIGFLRHRPSKRFAASYRQRMSLPPTGVQIQFRTAVAGPLALGHLSHFGLGLFAPMPSVATH